MMMKQRETSKAPCTTMICTECGRPFVPAPHNRERQKTCGRIACKAQRRKRLIAVGLAPIPPDKGSTMLSRARERRASLAVAA